MNRRLIIVLASALCAVVLIGALLWVIISSPRGRLYQGHTVDYWLAEVFTTNQAQALQVLRTVGPEGMPAVVHAFERTNSLRSGFYQTLYSKSPDWFQRRLTRPVRDDDLWSAAELVLFNNPNGRSALPGLTRLLADTNNPAHRYIFGAVAHWVMPGGKEMVPVLVGRLGESDAGIRKQATGALATIGSGAAAAIPALTVALQDPVLDVRVGAASALWRITHQPNPAAATLKAAIASAPSAPATYWAAICLGEIDPTDISAIPVVLNMLQSKSADLHVSAIVTLSQYGPAASAAVPALVKEIESSSPAKDDALRALKKIDPEAAAKYEAR